MGSFKDSFQRFIINWMHRKQSSTDIRIKNYSLINSVCVITELEINPEQDFLEKVKKAYRDSNKAVDIICYYPSKALPSSLVGSSFQVFSANDLNWIGLLKRDMLESIDRKSYDLMIYYNPNHLPPLEQIARQVDTRLLVGFKSESSLKPDVILHTKSPGLIHFIDTVNHYLKNINQAI
ncbi:MAG TPA: hypothetical protein VJ939_02495 [Bacteroidales bacterium]|nr:hypothetical protein [Bacteroidales bacterium]